MNPAECDLLTKVYNQNSMVLYDRELEPVARRLAERGFVKIDTHDDEGYELWCVTITRRGEVEINAALEIRGRF